MSEIRQFRRGRFISPGDKIGVIEEYVPGNGTYVEDGYIFSSIIGEILLDKEKHEISIVPNSRTPLIPKQDDIVICEVISVQEKTSTLKIIQINNTSLSTPFYGIIHVSDISSVYVKTSFDAIKVGDIVRAKVISTKNREFHLSTRNDELGVLQAFCVYCGGPLILQRNHLNCSKCSRMDKRKITVDYGTTLFQHSDQNS